jgi:hypothetical protein
LKFQPHSSIRDRAVPFTVTGRCFSVDYRVTNAGGDTPDAQTAGYALVYPVKNEGTGAGQTEHWVRE